ncbi:hypothetical protein BC936DRAFT_147744 [Jimgerdemannia flammicorona]|uniref:Uncharacterized protein n=1 Tax=Jimgerdemannia flammicorona TaxID=994334 RepID=A0A433DL30_9FUNG|nr:hypothetical protein BC936DRAFT_147744 [Jimgerdemannia flammicorona]
MLMFAYSKPWAIHQRRILLSPSSHRSPNPLSNLSSDLSLAQIKVSSTPRTSQPLQSPLGSHPPALAPDQSYVPEFMFLAAWRDLAAHSVEPSGACGGIHRDRAMVMKRSRI